MMEQTSLKYYQKQREKTAEYLKNKQKNRIKKTDWIYKNIYNKTRWQKLRKSFISEHPLCEECLKNNIYVGANHVHHIIPISDGKTESEMITLAHDEKNLQSLCFDCHKKHHQKEKEKKIDYFLFD